MTKNSQGVMPTPLSELRRDEIVRKKFGPFYFGYQQAAIDALEKKKKLPLSFPLSEGGRARAWRGGQIIDHIAEMQKLAAAELAAEEAARAAAVAKDQPPTPQPAGLAAAQKIKKVKLRPKRRQREPA
jgi:aminoglycoside phosphotransferase (APT) family kinase protein